MNGRVIGLFGVGSNTSSGPIANPASATAAWVSRLGWQPPANHTCSGVSRSRHLANAVGLVPRSRSQIWLRNQFLRALPHMPWKGIVAGGVQRAASAITLKDYVVDGTS